MTNVEVPQLVIFDCDGVLVDSERLCVAVESEMITAAGWPLSPTEVASHFLGKTDTHMVSEIERHLGTALPAEWLQHLHARYRERFETDLRPVEGVVEALNAIEATGVSTCVASSGVPEKIRNTLGLTGLRDRFEGRIFSAIDVEHGKPAPDLFLHAARSMGFSPRHTAVVEDSPAGTEAARSAGMRVLAYRTELVAPEALAGPNTFTFEDMLTLPALLSDEAPARRNAGAGELTQR